MRWYLFAYRRDYQTGEWKRSQIEIVYEDYTGKKTYRQVWNKLRPMVAHIHTSQLRLERENDGR